MTLAARLPPLLLGALVLHTAVVSQVRILGVSADLLLLVAVAAGMVAGPERGALVGFSAGLLADCFLQTPFGLSALCWSVVAFAVGTFQGTVLRAAAWIPPVTAAVASTVAVVVFALVGTVLGEGGLLGGRLLTVATVVGALHGVLLPLALGPVRWAAVRRRVPGVVLR